MSIVKVRLDSGEILELSGEYSSNKTTFNLNEVVSFDITINRKRIIHFFKAVTIDADSIIRTKDKEEYRLGKLDS